MGRVTDNGGSIDHHREMPRLFPGSIPDASRAHHGSEASRFLLQYLHPDFVNAERFISRSMQNSVRARARRDRRNIYLAIRTCNNSGYSATRADRCTTRVRLCSLSLV